MHALYVGYDERETLQYMVAKESVKMFAHASVALRYVWMRDLQALGLYQRPTAYDPLTDVISGAPMATTFAIARFFTPLLHRGGGLAAFVDCDVMFRAPVRGLFDAHQRGKAVSVVKHDYCPANALKMDGCTQTVYPRKNWSSVMVFDTDHPKIKALTFDYLNRAPGLELHQFGWLEDDDIGELPPSWNYLVGHTQCEHPALVHWTEGAPCMSGYEGAEYADEFWYVARRALR